MDTIPAILPTNMPDKSGIRFFFNNSSLLYNGTARTTVAGPRKNEINLPPRLYCSKLMLNISNVEIIKTVLMSKGFNKGILNLLYKAILISKHTKDIRTPNKGELIISVNFYTSLSFTIYKKTCDLSRN